MAMKTIGRDAHVSITSHELNDIPAKVDSGAYRCGINANDIKVSKDASMVSFNFEYNEITYRFKNLPIKKIQTVHNSLKRNAQQIVVQLDISIDGNDPVLVDVKLANRSELRFPFLIGRAALKRHYIIDINKSKKKDKKVKK